MPWFMDGKLISREDYGYGQPIPGSGNSAPIEIPYPPDPGDSSINQGTYSDWQEAHRLYPRGEGNQHIDPNEENDEPETPKRHQPAFKSSTRKEREEAKRDSPIGETLHGAASHYNPYKKGYKEGPRSGATSSGEKYDPNVPTAAIQQGLRGKFGGVHGGKPHYALVEYGGKKQIVKVNDVMPYNKGGRIIDLNEAAMKHFDPSMKKGVLSGVKVTPLGTEPHHEPASRHAALTPSHQAAPSTGVQIPRYGTADTARMHPDFRNRLNAMYAGMPAHLQKGTGVTSGYRTPAHQAALLAKPHRTGYVGSKYGSKHVHGIAADLKFGSSESRRWVHENAAKYGLHFPMGYEPWHIEPIGSRDKK